jgi:hypothetical protein
MDIELYGEAELRRIVEEPAGGGLGWQCSGHSRSTVEFVPFALR